MSDTIKTIEIGGRKIGLNCPPFIVAEMSGNHNQSLERALQIVDAAAHAGAHAIKIQTYTADTMTLDISRDEFFISNPNILWKGQSLYELYRKAYTPWEWHKPIFDRCRELGVIGFSTPFDETSLEFLEGLDVPCYKIASFENIDIPLIRKVASTGKPVVISTGMMTQEELSETVAAARDAGCHELVLLKCTSTYPAEPKNSNLATISDMRDRFHCHVGLSDHTLGIGVPLAGVAVGAVMIEKHFTLDRSEGGVDAAFSIQPDELKELVRESEKAWRSLGEVCYGPSEDEKESLPFRRSLYITHDIKAGEKLTKDNLRTIRPGLGLKPKYYAELLGRCVNTDIKRGTPMRWEFVK